jgi:hypothetical protein
VLRRIAAGAVAVGIVVALAACGDAGAGDSEEVAGVGQAIAGSVAALAQCSDWNAGGHEERLATIADIRAQLNQTGADGPTPDLRDDAAYDLFERACANDFASGFRLYKIYARGAAFSRLVE